MTSSPGWIEPPGSPPLISKSAPFLIERSDVTSTKQDLNESGAVVKEFSLVGVETKGDLFDRLRTVLIFPSWCGAGWNSFYDAFDEIRTETTFPLFVFTEGLQHLLSHRSHFALETVIRLAEAEREFARVDEQFVVIYVGEGW